jgi:uncharacterized protein (DUF427 family)
MTKATWNGAVVAEAQSDAVRILEGQVYFPPEAVDRRYLRESKTQTVSAALGVASYYDVVVDEEVNRDAAWSYAAPKPAGEEIAGYVAFWKGVAIEQDT